MHAVILAAGMGSRLGKYTKDSTKCMVKVDGITLLERIFSSIREVGINKVIIVTGYQAKALEDFAEKVKGELEITFVNNPDYSITNNIYSLYLASKEMQKDDTILFESDLIFDPVIVKRLAENEHPNLVAVSRFEEWMDGTVATFDSENNVTAIIDKKNFSWNDTAQYYKTVNIYKISKEFFTGWYCPFLEAYIKSCGYNAYYEEVLKVIANISGANLKVLDITGTRWYEIDTPQDLQTAQTIFGRDRLNDLRTRYGGYWRFGEIKDYCYLVNPFFPDERLTSELRYSFDTLLTQYPSGRKVIDSAAAAMFEIDEKHILTGNGAAELIKALMGELSGKSYITYPSFNEYINAHENEFITSDSSECGMNYDADYIISHMQEADNVIIINPDNPSGNYIEKNDMFKLMDICKEQDKKLIVDESFADFADEDKRYSLISDDILKEYPDLFVIKSISKSYGVPGLRLGVLCSSQKEMLKSLAKHLPIWNINSFAEYFLQIIGKYKKDHTISCDKLAAERKRFSKLLSDTGHIEVYPSQANFIMCRLLSKSAQKLSEFLLKHDYFIKSLTDKMGCKNGEFIRLAIRTPIENDELTELIEQYCKGASTND